MKCAKEYITRDRVVRYRIVYEHVNACVLCARVATDKLVSDAQSVSDSCFRAFPRYYIRN